MKNLVNMILSVLFLIGLFLNISGYLFLLGINFIAFSYLLIYIGAVSILLLFILMLINIRVAELSLSNYNSIPLAIFIGILTKSSLSEILFINDYNNNNIYYVTSNNWDNNLLEIIDITSLGNILYTNYWLWLIITSLILLLAMLGCILVTINKK